MYTHGNGDKASREYFGTERFVTFCCCCCCCYYFRTVIVIVVNNHGVVVAVINVNLEFDFVVVAVVVASSV